MPGFSVQIKDLPEQPGERKISRHWFLLLFGLLLLATGLKGLRDYFTLAGPALQELHQLRLTDVTNVVLVSEVPGSTRIDTIWLHAPDGAKIRYRNRFPYSAEIRRLDHGYGLLLDQTNRVWAVTAGAGEILGRKYFEEYNIEAKSVGKICGPFVTFFGIGLLLLFVLWERHLRGGKSLSQNVVMAPSGIPISEVLPPVRLRQVIIWSSIIGYAVLCFTVIFPMLWGKVPNWFIALLWVAGAGVIGNGFVAYFRRHPPRA